MIHVKSQQDEIRTAHYVPVHSQVDEAVYPLLDGRDDNNTYLDATVFVTGSRNKKSLFLGYQAILYYGASENSLNNMVTSFSGISQIDRVYSLMAYREFSGCIIDIHYMNSSMISA